MTRILVADDHEVVRSGLRNILEAHPNWEVVAEAADGKEAILKAIETKPDIAVIDYSLPLVNGMEVTRQIHLQLPKTEVLIFTMHDNETLIEELMKAGARGYLLKSDAKRYLVEAIKALAIHRPFFTATNPPRKYSTNRANQSMPYAWRPGGIFADLILLRKQSCVVLP